MKRNQKTVDLTKFSILLAIEALFCFTPLGSLPALGPIVATLALIPICITSILMGPKYGSLMGFFTGLFSFLVWSFAPPNPMIAFVFSPFYSMGNFHGNLGSVLICFLPRIVAGTTTGYLSRYFRNKNIQSRFVRYGVSSFVGSILCTLLVLGGIILFFGSEYTVVAGKALLAIIGSTLLFSGTPEAIIAALVSTAVCKPLEKEISH